MKNKQTALSVLARILVVVGAVLLNAPAFAVPSSTGAGSGGGGVSSVGIVAPADTTVSGSPVTGSGNITLAHAVVAVSSLPACNGGRRGLIETINDSLNACINGNAVTGGGGNSCSAFCDGNSWKILATTQTAAANVSGLGPLATQAVPCTIAQGCTSQTTAAAARGASGLNIDEATSSGDANYTMLATDRAVITSATLTAPRTWTLPAASAVNAGQAVMLADIGGGVSATNTLTIARAGSDTINGATSVVLSAARAALTLVSDGVSKWTIPGVLPFTCTNQVPTAFSASAAYTCSTITSAYVDSSILKSANNLSDLGSAATARTNLGLTASATNNGPCTDFWSPGAINQTFVAGHTYCPNAAGTYTFAAAQAVNVNNVTILCGNPGMVLQRTGATDLFDISGNQDTVTGCTLDGNSQTGASTGPLINLTGGSDALISYNIFQNVGITNPATGTIYSTAATNRERIIGNSVPAAINDTFINLDASVSNVQVDEPQILQNIIASWAPTTALNGALALKDTPGTGDIHNAIIEANRVSAAPIQNATTCTGAGAPYPCCTGAGAGTCNGNASIVYWFDSTSGTGASLFSLNWRITDNICTGTARWASCYFADGIDSSSWVGNVANDGGISGETNGFFITDSYGSSITGNAVIGTSASGFSNGIQLNDMTRWNITGNTVVLAGSSAKGFNLNTAAQTLQDGVANGNEITVTGPSSIGIAIACTGTSRTCSDIVIDGNLIAGGAASSQNGVQITPGTTSTMDRNQITNNHFRNFSGASSIGININNSVITNTIARNNIMDGVTTPVSDSGTTSDLQNYSTVMSGTLAAGTLALTIPTASTSLVAAPCVDNTTRSNLVTLAFTSSTTTATTVTATGTGTDAFSCAVALK